MDLSEINARREARGRAPLAEASPEELLWHEFLIQAHESYGLDPWQGLPRTIHWNTGRLYSSEGQRITATLHEDGYVTFWDHDRSINGEFRPNFNVHPDNFDRWVVDRVYDSGRGYQGHTRSWIDGMQRGGCNSRYAGPALERRRT